MLYNLFLRDEGDPSGDPKDPKDPKDPELGDPKDPADPQDGDPADPKKSEDDKGLSAEAKAELETLKKDKEDLEKRLSDTQEGFHEKNKALIALNERVDRLTRPVIKPEDEFAEDPEIQGVNREIVAYKERDYDIAPLKRIKAGRIREIKLEKRLSNLEARGKESDEIGGLLVKKPNIKDFKPVGEARKKLTDRGEKVSMDTAYYYDVGVKSEENFESAVKAEVEKRLEADKKGEEARGQDGDFVESEPSEDKEMTEYAEQLINPRGLDIQ